MPNRVTLRVDEKDFPSRFGNQAVWVSGKGPLRWLGHHVLDKVAASYSPEGIYLVVLSWVRLLGAVREIDYVARHQPDVSYDLIENGGTALVRKAPCRVLLTAEQADLGDYSC